MHARYKYNFLNSHILSKKSSINVRCTMLIKWSRHKKLYVKCKSNWMYFIEVFNEFHSRIYAQCPENIEIEKRSFVQFRWMLLHIFMYFFFFLVWQTFITFEYKFWIEVESIDWIRYIFFRFNFEFEKFFD